MIRRRQVPDKLKKPKWVKLRKTHGKVSARSYTGAEVVRIRQNSDISVPATPPRAGGSQGGITITECVCECNLPAKYVCPESSRRS